MPDMLPKEFQFSHEFCFYMHDYLVQIIKDGERDGIFQSKIYYRQPEDEDAVKGLSGDKLFSWLENNGYEYVVDEYRYRQICVALLSDMCHFLYEVLRCSKLGKQTVVFALLRKPIKENLFYLEWLLAEPQDF